MKTGIFLPLAGALLLAVSGCKTSVNSVENAQKSGQRQMVADQRAVTDRTLGNRVSIVGVNTAMTPGGLLKVQVELLNTTRSSQNFSYHFEWFDENGMKLSALTPAEIPSVIQGRESMFISSVAPTPAVKDFRVKFIQN